MRLLLFFISAVFSIIFYIFHSLSKGMDIFGDRIANTKVLDTLSGNLLIESFVFILIGLLFVFYFSPLNGEKSLITNKKRVFYFVFYILFISISYFIEDFKNNHVIIFVILFLFSDITFNFLSNLNVFSEQKINLRIFSLILNYINIFLGFYILIKLDFFTIVFFIMIFNVVFNFFIHKDYINYVSLTFSVFSLLGLFYVLFLQLEEFFVLFL